LKYGDQILYLSSFKIKSLFKTLYSNKKNKKNYAKIKTRKAAAKTYKITGNNNFLRRHALKVIFNEKSNKQKTKIITSNLCKEK
jgi:ribosomal protein L35